MHCAVGGKQMMPQVLGFLLPTSQPLLELLGLGFSLPVVGIWKVKQQMENLFLSVSVSSFKLKEMKMNKNVSEKTRLLPFVHRTIHKISTLQIFTSQLKFVLYSLEWPVYALVDKLISLKRNYLFHKGRSSCFCVRHIFFSLLFLQV